MAEAIAFNVVADILFKMGDAAFREICSVYGVRDDMKKFERTLITLNAALQDADRRQEESNLIKVWISALNDVVYDADDVLDAFNTKNLQRQLNIEGRAKRQVREFFSSSNPLVFRYKLSRTIKKIRERLYEIAKNMGIVNFVVTERVIDQTRVGGIDRETISYVAESYVIGRKKEKEEIIDMLMCSSNEEKVSIVSIVGIGGLGKTTLAQSVYCDKRVVDHFGLMIWVCVSEDFEKKSLVKRILKSEVGDLEQLQSKLRDYIDGKRYLLILDDIWNEDREKWIGVKTLLEGGAQGSKILVTTRSTKVTSAMDVKTPYTLEGLTEEHSWTLFEKVAFRGENEVRAYMKFIGKEIIKRCKGVPLAIRSLGSVMESKTTESQWLVIQNSDIWSSLENNNSILPILKLSYDHLPIHLRQCFVYCSIFPKDHTLEKDLLVQLWMAQGYIQCSSESQDLEDIGDQYFEDLISRSFLQDVEVTSGNVCCKMHDLIHDLAVRVGGPRYCSIAKNSSVSNFERVNHVSFGLLKNVPTQLIQAKGLRTYFSTEEFHSWRSLKQARPNKLLLSKIRRLRALDLRKCGIEKLSKLVGKMQHLRFLDLSFNEKMEVLPNSITNLVNLQMLNLSSCIRLKELPEDISKLISLRHLIIGDCCNITRMPRGLGKLTSLRTLNLSSCEGLKELPEGISKLISLRHLIIDHFCKITRMPRGLGKLTSLQTLSKFIVGDDKRSAKLEELKGLNNLRGDLCIENLEKVKNSGSSESKEAILMGKQYLKSLTLNWNRSRDEDKDAEEIVLEGLQPHPNLKELRINYYCGVRFPSWITSLSNIVEIYFFSCRNIRNLPPFHQLPCLKTLTLYDLDEVEYDDGSSSSSFSPSFPCLTHLVIHNCPKLTSMPLAPLLEKLEIYNCHKLTSMPLAPLLEKLEISDCPRLTSMPFAHLLEKLEIYNCPKLTSMPGPPLLDTLSLWSVSQKLVFQLLTTATRTTTAATIPSSSPLSRLTDLSIWYMEGIESLPFFPEGVPQNLTSLKKLEIRYCPRLLHLAVSGEIQHLTALEELHIHDCKELDLTHDGMNWQGLRSLRKIYISNIPKLVSLPEWLQHITTLEELGIDDLEELDLTHDGMNWQGLRRLRTIYISNIPKLVSLPEWLQHINELHIGDFRELDWTHDGMNWQGLRSLRTIIFRNIPKLVSLPEWLQHITTLEHLTISDCKELDLTHDGMNWQGLRSLRKIWISNIPKLVSLPEGLQHITTLQSVLIENCPGLVDLPEWRRNIPYFSIIRYR